MKELLSNEVALVSGGFRYGDPAAQDVINALNAYKNARDPYARYEAKKDFINEKKKYNQSKRYY